MKSIYFVFLLVGHSMVSGQSLSGRPEDDEVCQRYDLERAIGLADFYGRSIHNCKEHKCNKFGPGSVCCTLDGERTIFRCFGGTKKANPSACSYSDFFRPMTQPGLLRSTVVTCEENWDCQTRTIQLSYCCEVSPGNRLCVKKDF